jgi:heavy metal sensor kinase
VGELVVLYQRSDAGYDVASTRSIGASVEGAWIEGAFNGHPTYVTAIGPGGELLRLYVALFRPPGAPRARPAGQEEPPLRGEGLADELPEPVVAVVGRPMDIVTSGLSALRGTLLIAVPLTLLLSAVGGLFLVRRVLAPVDRMIETARSIEETDLTGRVDVRANDELGRLAATFNAMLERLESAFRRQRQFTDDASHELRSPLSVIEAEATLALRRERSADDYRDALATIADEAAGMNRMIDQLLTLARGDAAEDEEVLETVDLGALARETSEAMRPVAEEAGVSIAADEMPGALVAGDPVRLRRVVANLIDNAIRYTPAGGGVTVSVRGEANDAVLTVSDTGIGISEEQLVHIFERFYRADGARQRGQGSGLGLSICRQIVDEHGGTIAAESAEGEGTTFTVRIPAASKT